MLWSLGSRLEICALRQVPTGGNDTRGFFMTDCLNKYRDVRFGLGQMLACGILFFATILCASSSLVGQQLTSGTGSRSAKEEAIKSVPLHELTPEAQTKVTSILQNHSLYRRLPTTAIECDPEYFVFLCRYPEVIVETWRLMGVSAMATQRTAPFTLHTNDGAGSVSDVELIYGNDNVHLFYGTGTYEGPVLHKPVNGQCVMLLRTENSQGSDGRMVATSQLDVFLKIENAAAGMIARTLNPLVGKTADQNFVESMKFVQRLNETTEKNGPGVQGMAYRLEGLTPEVRQNFIDIVAEVFEKKQASMIPQSQRPPVVQPAQALSPATTQGPIRYTITPRTR